MYEQGTHQHECTDCDEIEECNDTGTDDECTKPGAGWIRGRFYCKDCAETRC